MQPSEAFTYDVTFIVVTYNSEKIVRDAIDSCITAIQRYYPQTGRVVVYDNASSDRCPEILDEYSRRYPQEFLGIKSQENVGFGRANNAAAATSPSKTYVLINPDVSFEPESFATLEQTLQQSQDVAIACPKLLYPDSSVQPSIRRFPSFTYFILRQLLGEEAQQWLYPFEYFYDRTQAADEGMEVNWAIGAYLVVSGRYVARHGLFDDRFFLYFEDVSLCVDAWQNGYRVLYQPQSVALHSYQRASTRSRFNRLTLMHTVSALKFFAKYRPYQKRWQLIAWLLEMRDRQALQSALGQVFKRSQSATLQRSN